MCFSATASFAGGVLISGLSVSVYYAFCLIFLNVTPQINGYHIKYINDFPRFVAYPVFFIYLIATITPLLYRVLSERICLAF